MTFSRQVYIDACEQERGLDRWSQHYTQLKPGGYEGCIETLGLPGVTIARERINVAVEERVAAPEGTLVYVQSLGPAPSCVTNACRVPTGGVMMLRGGEEIHVATDEATDLLIATVDARALPEGEPPPRSPPLLFSPGFPQAELATAWFLSLILGQETGLMVGMSDHAPILGQLVVDRLAALFGMIAQRGRSPDPATRDEYRLFQRARALVLAEEAEEHTPAGLAARLGVSPEALRRAVTATVGVGPAVWLRQMRLDGAHRDLAAGGRGATVSDIAMKWGFWHLGRFSSTYAAVYGEPPSQTMRRAGG